MITSNELLRRLNNLVNTGTVHSISENKKLAQVNILGRITAPFPIMGDANTFKRKASPVRVGEQVAVFCPMGNSDFGFIIAGMFNIDCKEPDGFNKNIEITEYEDGTTISYDVKAKELKVNAVNKINIFCKSANIQAESINIKATTTHKGDLTIDGNLKVSGDIKNKGDLSVDGDLTVGGVIEDEKGDLTSHTHLLNIPTATAESRI